MQPSSNAQAGNTGNPLVGQLTPGRLGENTASAPQAVGVTSGAGSYNSTTTGTGSYSTSTTGAGDYNSGLGTTTGTGGLPSTGSNTLGVNGAGTTGVADKGLHHSHHHHHGHQGVTDPISTSHLPGTGTGAAAGAATGAGLGHHHHSHHGATDPTTTTGSSATGASQALGSGPQGATDFSRSSGMPSQETCGNHLVPGMEEIGTGYSGPHTKRGDISAPTGALPAGTVEKGATNQPIPRPSAKDFFKMSNAGVPAAPTALANRPVHQDPISEADHIAPTHGHSGTPGNMASTVPSERQEGVDAYAARAHGDHLVQGVDAGTGYAGATAARGDTTAPTGSLPAGSIEAGAQNMAVPRPSAKDQFLMHNASTPSNPVSLAKRLFRDNLGIGKSATEKK